MEVDLKITQLKGVDKVINAVRSNLLFDWISRHWDHGLNTFLTSKAFSSMSSHGKMKI